MSQKYRDVYGALFLSRNYSVCRRELREMNPFFCVRPCE